MSTEPDPKRVLPNDYGIRPAGPPDACFYCGRSVGDMHGAECVTLRTTLRTTRRVRLTVEYDIEAPACWSPEQIASHRNGSSWCRSNAIAELEERFGDGSDVCGCEALRFEVWDWKSEEWIQDED